MLGGTVGGRSAPGRGTDGSGPGIGIGPGRALTPLGLGIGGRSGGGKCGDASGPGGGIGGIPVPAAGGDAIGPEGASSVAGTLGELCVASALPQLRQNFIPGGF